LQYTPLAKLGSGSFGQVVLSRHNNSGVKVAVKQIDKTVIDQSFTQNNQKFCELDIMEEVCHGQCPNVIELVESFEDETHYYIVTKLQPDGDLLKYLLKNNNQPLEE
jgi:serine/threonine protein kinase